LTGRHRLRKAKKKANHMVWSLLALAVTCDVLGTLCLRMGAGAPSMRWGAATAVLYVTGVLALGAALRMGMAVSLAYAIWASLGIALVAVAGAVLFGDRLAPVQIAGIFLVIGGVVLLQVTA
jgi:small multidrug resistance pump